MSIKEDIISQRYKNDGIPLVSLDDRQKKYLKLFLNDPRISYSIIRSCPLCACKNVILIAQKERYAIPLDTVVCDNCGFVWSFAQLDEKSSRIFYTEYYRNIYEPLSSEMVEEEYSQGGWKKFPAYLGRDKVVLEIGCGGGWSLTPYHAKGYIYYGFDFDENFIEYGRKKGLNLYVGGVEEVKRKGIRCDYLLINHVFEHVSHPVNFLKSLKPILNKDAIINIYVPSLDLLLWGYGDSDLLGTLQNAHNFLYDEFTLTLSGKLAGFKIVNCLAMNLVLRYEKKLPQPIRIFNLNRGKKIVRYLKFVEKTLMVRKKIGLEYISCKKIYCLINPLGCYKRFTMEYLGKL